GTLRGGPSFSLQGVEFPAGQASLTETSLATLSDLATVLAAHPESRLRIEDNLDPGSLSQRRAEAVVTALIEAGAPPATLPGASDGGIITQSGWAQLLVERMGMGRALE